MSDPFLGEIRPFGFTFAPSGWALCNGQLLSIAQNSALFSLLGTTYGGDGQTTFGLPNLQGRVPMHFGNGPGLTPRTQGESAGTETVTLVQAQIPAHVHPGVSPPCSTDDPISGSPKNNFPAAVGSSIYSTTSNATMGAGGTTGLTGGNQPHTNLQPFLVINFCIALQGIYPSRA